MCLISWFKWSRHVNNCHLQATHDEEFTPPFRQLPPWIIPALCPTDPLDRNWFSYENGKFEAWLNLALALLLSCDVIMAIMPVKRPELFNLNRVRAVMRICTEKDMIQEVMYANFGIYIQSLDSDMEMLSFWRNYMHWLHQKLSFWHLT